MDSPYQCNIFLAQAKPHQAIIPILISMILCKFARAHKGAVIGNPSSNMPNNNYNYNTHRADA